MTKTRTPLQVSPKFLQGLKDLQRKVRMSSGDDISLRELTDNLVSTQAFQEVERRLIKGDLKADIQIRFDMRKTTK